MLGLASGLGLEVGATLVRRSAEARRARLRASEWVGVPGAEAEPAPPSEGRGGLRASSGVERLALDVLEGAGCSASAPLSPDGSPSRK